MILWYYDIWTTSTVCLAMWRNTLGSKKEYYLFKSLISLKHQSSEVFGSSWLSKVFTMKILACEIASCSCPLCLLFFHIFIPNKLPGLCHHYESLMIRIVVSSVNHSRRPQQRRITRTNQHHKGDLPTASHQNEWMVLVIIVNGE